MEIKATEMEFTFIRNLDVNFWETWSSIGEDLQNKLLKESFMYLRYVWNHSDFHQMIYTMLLGIYQNLVSEPGNLAWEFLHQFTVDETLPVSGRNNAVWVFLGIIGQLLDHTSYKELINDCIYMLLKNMTIGVPLDKVSLNIRYFEKLDVGSQVKQSGIGLFTVLGLYMPMLWPICCCQLQRLMNEENELLKTIKLFIAVLDFRHSGEFFKESSQECDLLVCTLVKRAGNSSNVGPYLNWIQQAHKQG